MDPEVLSEAKDFVSAWIDKAGADGNGVNTEVSRNRCCNSYLISMHAKELKMLWIVNSVHTGTALWVRASHLKLHVKQSQLFTCIMQERLQYCFSNAERSIMARD